MDRRMREVERVDNVRKRRISSFLLTTIRNFLLSDSLCLFLIIYEENGVRQVRKRKSHSHIVFTFLSFNNGGKICIIMEVI